MALKQKDQGYNFKAHDSRKQIMDFFGSDSFNDQVEDADLFWPHFPLWLPQKNPKGQFKSQ